MREALASEIRNALRYVRANWLVAKVLASYIGLYTLYKLFGADRIRARIDRTHERNAQRVLDGILELKAVYIKLGFRYRPAYLRAACHSYRVPGNALGLVGFRCVRVAPGGPKELGP